MTKVIYVQPDYMFEQDWFESLSDEEKLHVAKNENEMEVYTLENFQYAFNEERISDLGFIYFVTI